MKFTFSALAIACYAPGSTTYTNGVALRSGTNSLHEPVGQDPAGPMPYLAYMHDENAISRKPQANYANCNGCICLGGDFSSVIKDGSLKPEYKILVC